MASTIVTTDRNVVAVSRSVHQQLHLGLVFNVGAGEGGESLHCDVEGHAVLEDVGDVFKSVARWR